MSSIAVDILVVGVCLFKKEGVRRRSLKYVVSGSVDDDGDDVEEEDDEEEGVVVMLVELVVAMYLIF